MWMAALPQSEASMKALVYTDTQKVEYTEQPDPVCGPGEVLVNIEAAGICGSDMHAFLGHDPRRVPPLILGHEASGTVASGPLTGRKVVLNPLITCGQCDHCLDGRANLCAQRDLIGMYRPGAFAEQIAIPERNVVELPKGMSTILAALAEPAATAVHAVNLADRALYRPLSDTRALVIGAGSVGLFSALALKERGVVNIVIAEANPVRRETATAADTGAVLDPESVVREEAGFELVIDAVGGSQSRQTAIKAIRPGGVVMHIGLLDSEGALDMRKLTLQEITIIGTYTYTPVDFRSTVKKLHSGALGRLDWFDQRSLTEGARAFSDLLNGQCAAPKIILCP